MSKKLPLILTVVVVAGLLLWLQWPQQEADPAFDTRVAQPAFTAAGLRVYFDEGHYNVHKSGGRYKPFADLLRADGFIVEPHDSRVTRGDLEGYKVLVIANALGFRGAAQAVANNFGLEKQLSLEADAFTPEECRAVREWVNDGGSLLLIADHAPAGAAARQLAREFGVEMTNWYAEDGVHHDPESGHWGNLVFSRENGLLLDHPVTQGRSDAERVERVVTFVGQTLKAPAGAFLKFSPEAIEYPYRDSPDDSFRRVPDGTQGVALEFGRGRVVILGEAAMLTSQVVGAGRETVRLGMDYPGCDNRQLALNILHWLSRLY